MSDERVRYSDADLQEFRAIIKEKIEKRKKIFS
jgi:hypothetical protein